MIEQSKIQAEQQWFIERRRIAVARGFANQDVST